MERGLALLHEGLRLQPDNIHFRHMIAQWQRKHGEREVRSCLPSVEILSLIVCECWKCVSEYLYQWSCMVQRLISNIYSVKSV